MAFQIPGGPQPTPTNTTVIQSGIYLRQSSKFQKEIDRCVKSIKNLTVAGGNLTTVNIDLIAAINDLRTMDTLVWAFINPEASQTFPVYTATEVLSRGPFLSNNNNTQRTVMLTSLTPILTNIVTAYTAQTNTPIIVSQQQGTQNQRYIVVSGYQTAYTDLITKLNAAIALIPGLITH